MKTSFKGSCLCGAVTFKGVTNPSFVSHCCCQDCRKTSGTGHSTDFGATWDEVSIEGALNTFSNLADSGNTITRHFCPTCGSKIATTNSAYPNDVAINIATLETPDAFTPDTIHYASDKIAWDKLDLELELPKVDE